MDNLRQFLASRCRKRLSVSGKESWEHLTRRLDDLKEQDCNATSIKALSYISSTGIASTDIDIIVNNCIKALQRISSQSSHPFAIPPAKSEAICNKAVEDLKHLNSGNLLCKHEFVKDLINTDVTIPLQLIWQLQNAGLLQISTYIFRKIQLGNEPPVSSAIFWLFAHSTESMEYVEVATETLASLLIASQSGHLNLELSSACSSILKKCTENMVNYVMASPQSCSSDENSIDFSYLLSSKLWSCGAEAMEQYILAHLLHLLNQQCVPHSTQALMDAVSIQEKASLDSITLSFQNLLFSITKGLSGEKIIYELGAAVVRHSVNWKVIFLLITVVLTESSDCHVNLRKLIDELIQLGLEGGRQTELSAGFLLARQCCSCDSKNFGSYSSWFSSHFGPDSVTARNIVQFQSLLQLLTDIVPVESAENLRVHINKVPQAPTSCNSILHDYTVLARTRLADLNESSELAGLFSDSKKDAFPGLDSRQGDIVKVLQHFQQTHEIMKPVIEASIFRRQYYKNVFLVQLLGLPGSTEETFKLEDFELSNDLRQEFILALKALGKIPDKMFRSYSQQEVRKSDSVDCPSRETVTVTKNELDQSTRKKSLKVNKLKRL